jgi:folate-binding protein YgfZ
LARPNTNNTAAACSGDSSVAAITSSAPKLFDLSARTKLRVTGADRARYLNGQITNDLRKATRDIAIRAAVLNVKGRIDADIFIHDGGDSFVIDADAALRAGLAARLERYVIADDVQIEDVTDEFALFHLLDSAHTAIAAERFGSAGTDLWIMSSEAPAQLHELAASCEVYDEQRAETFRIERGVARWGFELSNDIIPVEANLESAAIDYMKGCYTGQEVISRMKMSGQTNKRLRGLISTNGVPLRRGTRLSPSGEPTRDVGWITSASRSDFLQKEIALGFVKRGYNDPGTSLLAADSAVEVVELPFV